MSSWALFRYQRQWRLSQDRGQARYHQAQQQADHQTTGHRRIRQQKNDGTEPADDGQLSYFSPIQRRQLACPR